jgi:hypothetical protein
MERELPEGAAHNESIFREVNEALKQGHWPGEGESTVGFRCECAALGCSRIIELTLSEYERIRAHPKRFLVAPGHELADVETVVERHESYVVVEKRGESGRIAAREDPRS